MSLRLRCSALASRPPCRLPRHHLLGSSHLLRTGGVLPLVSSPACFFWDHQPTLELTPVQRLREINKSLEEQSRAWDSPRGRPGERAQLRKSSREAVEDMTQLRETILKEEEADEGRMLVKALAEELDRVWDYIDDMEKMEKSIRKSLQEYDGTAAGSIEQQVIKAVRLHLGAEHHRVCLDFKILTQEGPALEVDGVLQLEGWLAAVRADYTVDPDTVTRLERACREMEHKEGVPVRGFIGGQAFIDGAEAQALQAGLTLVVESEIKFRVVQPDDNRSVTPSQKQKEAGDRINQVV